MFKITEIEEDLPEIGDDFKSLILISCFRESRVV